MRAVKIATLVLGILNIAVCMASLSPRRDERVQAVLPQERRRDQEKVADGLHVVFMPFNERRARPEGESSPSAPQGDANGSAPIAIDTSSFLYMGRMKDVTQGDVYFVKEKATNRVYDIGVSGFHGTLLSSDDSRVLFEIGGKRYEVAR